MLGAYGSVVHSIIFHWAVCITVPVMLSVGSFCLVPLKFYLALKTNSTAGPRFHILHFTDQTITWICNKLSVCCWGSCFLV